MNNPDAPIGGTDGDTPERFITAGKWCPYHGYPISKESCYKCGMKQGDTYPEIKENKDE